MKNILNNLRSVLRWLTMPIERESREWSRETSKPRLKDRIKPHNKR